MQAQTDYAVGWFTLALLTAGVAQGKNRRGLNWFLLGLLLGPLATFLLVAAFDKLENGGAAQPALAPPRS